MPSFAEITQHLDALLRTDAIADYGPALNGVQVETDAEITSVAAAVDARERTIAGALDAGANLLLVHHGLFWGGLQPLTGAHRRRLHAVLTAGLGVYSAHLPLDAHPELGNNVLLARELRLTPTAGFAKHKGTEIGVAGEDDLPTATLLERADRFARGYGGSAVCAGEGLEDGARRTRRWALVTGAGADADTLREAGARGIDTLVVGEGPHWSAVAAAEQGLCVIYAGHYATETLGVQALARHVSERFGVPWTFVHAPTGL